MERKKSPLQLPKEGRSVNGSDSAKMSSHHSSNVLVSSPAVLPAPPFYISTPTSLVAASSHLAVNNSVDDWNHGEDSGDADIYGLSGSLPSLGSNDELHFAIDDSDIGISHATDPVNRLKAAIEHIQMKIMRTKELIKVEQTARDENVNEYLKLATNADRQQLQRIKSVFEKKNQKSAQTITQLQKKLENYSKKIKVLETHGLPRWAFKDVGQGLKGVVDSFKNNRVGRTSQPYAATENAVSKHREFAHLVKKQFGSADNISFILKSEESAEDPELNIHGSAALSSHRHISDEENSSAASETAHYHSFGEAPHPTTSPHHAALHSGAETSLFQNLGSASFDLEPILLELRSQRDDYQHLVEEIETVKGQIQQESTYFSQALQEERYRYERLEEQMNDLIELHQNEIENLKQGVADMEEKVQYQSEERLRDVHDFLESCQTRISRMEHQQHQHLQQLVTLDAVENSQARALLLKLINVALTVLQVVLLLVATMSNIIMPFLRTRVRTLTTFFLIFIIVIVCHQWPELLELCRLKIDKFISPLIAKLEP